MFFTARQHYTWCENSTNIKAIFLWDVILQKYVDLFSPNFHILSKDTFSDVKRLGVTIFIKLAQID